MDRKTKSANDKTRSDSEAIIDTYGNDLSEVIAARAARQLQKKQRNKQRYARRTQPKEKKRD